MPAAFFVLVIIPVLCVSGLELEFALEVGLQVGSRPTCLYLHCIVIRIHKHIICETYENKRARRITQLPKLNINHSIGRLTADMFETIFNKKLKNGSCEDDRWVFETQLCELRDTSGT